MPNIFVFKSQKWFIICIPLSIPIFYHLYRFSRELKFMVFWFFQTSGRRINNFELSGACGCYEAEIDGKHGSQVLALQ